MKHTPYGYDIVGGKAVVNEKEASNIRSICVNYLSGMGLAESASVLGLKKQHTAVKRMVTNKKYLGDDFYPQILTPEMFAEVEKELVQRCFSFGRDHLEKLEREKPVACTAFSMPRIPQRYSDPVKQAEYAYSMIRNEVSR